MRKLVSLLFMTSCFFLVACGEEALTKEEVLEQATKASGEMESFTAEVNMLTEVEGEEFSIKTTSDVTSDPETLHMKMDMGMPGISVDVDIYMVEEEVYMKMLGEWMTTDIEEFGMEDFDELSEEELERFEPFVEEMEMIEEENTYVLTLSGEDADFAELLDVYLEFAMEDVMDPVFEETLQEEISFQHYEMEMRVDKDSMLIETQHVQADMELDGEPFEIEVDMTISNVNEVEPIELPEEAKENAINLDEMDEADEDLSYIDEAMPLEEIEEMVSYSIPAVTYVPDGYELMDSYFYADDYTEFVYLVYQKHDFENGFILSIYPTVEAYGGVYESEWSETVSVNGNEGMLEEIDPSLMFLTWEQEDVFLELIGEGTEMSSELLLEIAESVE